MIFKKLKLLLDWAPNWMNMSFKWLFKLQFQYQQPLKLSVTDRTQWSGSKGNLISIRLHCKVKSQQIDLNQLTEFSFITVFVLFQSNIHWLPHSISYRQTYFCLCFLACLLPSSFLLFCHEWGCVVILKLGDFNI